MRIAEITYVVVITISLGRIRYSWAIVQISANTVTIAVIGRIIGADVNVTTDTVTVCIIIRVGWTGINAVSDGITIPIKTFVCNAIAVVVQAVTDFSRSTGKFVTCTVSPYTGGTTFGAGVA